jgi:hypothetical protein
MGEFIIGGLLLLTKKHIPSFSYLSDIEFSKLNVLVAKIKLVIKDMFGISPLIFEHESSLASTVDHAHLNIFPTQVNVHEFLVDRIKTKITDYSELKKLRKYPRGYLFLDSPYTGKYVYDGINVESQQIRKIITAQLGIKDRWNWKNYLGINEMIETKKRFSGVFYEKKTES